MGVLVLAEGDPLRVYAAFHPTLRSTLHSTYLSTSNSFWRLIYQGQPLCADTPSRDKAEACAKQFKVVPTAIWNGDTGLFEAYQPEWKRYAAVL